ncbi:lycopene cyclase family protein [Flavobacterium yafengii]|uniref:lycopene cyclase family protein n=1 Tax=Flavobacterium yafengii TaxID=3041253 RepID=UPI0024A86EC9|nr:lycopene cyclase family protein [Flavobacterium yafengii]
MKHYDYIFTGAGLSALMTVYKMVQSGKFKNTSILLLDENTKKTNDRTWCFWKTNDSVWEQSISKKWDSALFANENFRRDLDLQPYHYNMVKGLDFYNQVFDLLSKQENITFLPHKVLEIEESETIILVQTESESFSCSKLFNSIYNKHKADNQTKYPVLQQHFIGWFIKSEQAVFNSEQATFMDFSVEQKGNTRFMYVLPISKTEALLEYTLFSHQHLKTEEYENEIQQYIEKLGITNYEIVEKEQGSIPMTCYPFWKANTKNVLNIGTSGGWTKASTGYTFKNSDKKSSELVAFLQRETDFTKFHKKTKFWFYDLLLLDILDRKNELGSHIFSSMFKKGNPSLIFKFLDEETSFIEDIKVILKCPKMLFIKALFHVALKTMK